MRLATALTSGDRRLYAIAAIAIAPTGDVRLEVACARAPSLAEAEWGVRQSLQGRFPDRRIETICNEVPGELYMEDMP